jgi:hypothetical protein
LHTPHQSTGFQTIRRSAGALAAARARRPGRGGQGCPPGHGGSSSPARRGTPSLPAERGVLDFGRCGAVVRGYARGTTEQRLVLATGHGGFGRTCVWSPGGACSRSLTRTSGCGGRGSPSRARLPGRGGWSSLSGGAAAAQARSPTGARPPCRRSGQGSLAVWGLPALQERRPGLARLAAAARAHRRERGLNLPAHGCPAAHRIRRTFLGTGRFSPMRILPFLHASGQS